MIALVTGATGFVGQHLIAALRGEAYRVRALALPGEDTSRLEQQEVTVYRGDIRDAETLVEPIHGADIVFHLAAVHGLWRPRREYDAINLQGTENICRCALKVGVQRFIHMSSWVVYGMGIDEPVREHFPLRPFPDAYALTKAKADSLVQNYVEHGLPAIILRPGTIFGPGDLVNFKRLADRLRKGTAIIIGSGNNRIPLVYVADVVQAILLAARKDRALGQCYNIGNDQPSSQQQLWNAIAEEIESPPPRIHVPYYALYALAAMAELTVAANSPKRQPLVTRLGVKLYGTDNRHAIDKARVELGFQPRTSIRDGVRLAAQWYLQGAIAKAAEIPSVRTQQNA